MGKIIFKKNYILEKNIIKYIIKKSYLLEKVLY